MVICQGNDWKIKKLNLSIKNKTEYIKSFTNCILHLLRIFLIILEDDLTGNAQAQPTP